MTPTDRSGSADQPRLAVRLAFLATAMAVRGALADLRSVLAPMDLAPVDLDQIELVLAEVLNNVVEHAYAGTDAGSVRVSAWPVPLGLAFRVEDDGRPMPGCALPPGKGPILTTTIEDLPEGGFGWFMIHTLTRDLAYRRIGPRNCLTFRMPFGGALPG